jgi:hypothetical protein
VSKPLLGHGCDDVAVALDVVFVVDDVAVSVEVRAVFDVDVEAVTDPDQGLVERR